MKPISQADYPIKVFLYTAENWGSELYEGLYGLRLNYSVNVCLCPAYDFLVYGFPPDPQRLLAHNPTSIQSPEAARAETAMSSGPLVLLEREEQAGQLVRGVYTQANPNRDGLWQLAPNLVREGATYPKQDIVYFYCLTHAEYEQYTAELEAILNREFSSSILADQPNSYNKLRNLRHFDVIARIHELLNTCPYLLSDYQRELLAL
jgi:hypothetical protein